MSMKHAQLRHRQPDLFETDEPPAAMTLSELRQLTPLVSALLIEVVLDRPAREGDHEDHA
jgi:hypothetical protein